MARNIIQNGRDSVERFMSTWMLRRRCRGPLYRKVEDTRTFRGSIKEKRRRMDCRPRSLTSFRLSLSSGARQGKYRRRYDRLRLRDKPIEIRNVTLTPADVSGLLSFISPSVDRKYGESCFPVASSTRPIRTTALAQTTAVRFTRDVAVRHKPENGEHQGGQDMMTTTFPIPEVTRLLTDPEGAANRRRDAEPIDDPVLADAEEEEMAVLWAGDPGNQGA